MSSGCESQVRKTVCKYLVYSYKTSDGSLRTIRLPLVQVYLKSPVANTNTIGLVDSGATKTILPQEYGEILSLQYEKDASGRLLRSETIGAGGTFFCLVATLQKLALKRDVVPFCTLTNVPVLVAEPEGALPYVILGRDYVFSRFDITFHERRQKMTFTRA